ncbi:MAG: tRNA (adenosine(37)-N6)-threonylcarbamoyltransferase complex ATPase subunit type 1 TsaE [Sporolactobacillus sp.]
MRQFITHSPEETMDFAERMVQQLKKGMVFTLSGDLGAGKTQFAKGLARGLGVRETVNSPTFTIVKEYRSGRMPLFHMDVYRISEEEDIGIEDYFDQDGLVVIEWAENIESWLPESYVQIRIIRQGEQDRKLVLDAVGAAAEQLCEEIDYNESAGH